mmetsp:Transcript_46767/g.99941  ORF Transcript_46767/g.99941 Transcript_46767/m.99941 type:complete len:354 (+) Transcript_46767:75-1136(+)|eukprot:CAMPEP_0180442002 /NCGR_PEP_ID=MMETSP1036_2-20121128/13916_1 /TAXON_ID=632150 /ORGANISM="Azadinium spinosum, Strain 3D9" /LENGTH=353 /DNA_ID=CAMNT_0022448233 /DNA_START=79 /DNA_END=1140 /DNA_ORIENTATION=-
MASGESEHIKDCLNEEDSTIDDSREYGDADELAAEIPHEIVLQSFDLDGIAQYVMEKNVRRIIVMCGAGISTSAGIPDFRTPGTGLYDNLQQYDLPEPESIFNLKFFQEEPDAFYELCKHMWPGNYEPTLCHHFIRLLSDKGVLLRCYTQNIDSLERQAGIPEDQIVAAHGNFDVAHVIDDNVGLDATYDVDIAELKAALDVSGTQGWEELREIHGGLVKPKIVFFGEDLPERFETMHQADLEICELLIVMGTSLAVYPFNSLLELACPTVPRLLVNCEPAGLYEELPGGFRFHLQGEGQNWRDVFCHGDCDSGAQTLAEKLGWASDLRLLIDSKGAARVPRASWASDAPCSM